MTELDAPPRALPHPVEVELEEDEKQREQTDCGENDDTGGHELFSDHRYRAATVATPFNSISFAK